MPFNAQRLDIDGVTLAILKVEKLITQLTTKPCVYVLTGAQNLGHFVALDLWLPYISESRYFVPISFSTESFTASANLFL